MKTFDEVWQEVEPIDGWLSRREAELLYASAAECEGAIVEIGCYHGRSTRVLAESGKPVLTIDPDPAVQDRLPLALNCHTNVKLLTCKSEEVSLQQAESVGLLYIDGDHELPQPKNDFIQFHQALRPGSLVAFHDYERDNGVTFSVSELVADGILTRKHQAGSLWIGEYTGASPPSVTRAFLIQPSYGGILPAAYQAAQNALKGATDDLRVTLYRPKRSLLANGLNGAVCHCLSGGYEYMAICHGDIEPDEGWLRTLRSEMNANELDVIHAVARLKDDSGLTSTALAYSDDGYAPSRRITLKELQKLPPTFDIEAVRNCIDIKAQKLLPNTGCMLIHAKVLQDFPGFCISDRLCRENGELAAQVIPEDWAFGHWCHDHGFKVGGTKRVRTKHYEMVPFDSSVVCGREADEKFFNMTGAA